MNNKQTIFVHDYLFPQINSEEQFQIYAKEHPEFDPEYILQHCYIPRKETRDWIESIWEKYDKYAEPNFLTHIREPRRFHPFTWQIYLASVLLNNGYQLQTNNGSGPDLQVNTKKGNVWIEATVTTAGDDESANGLPRSGEIYNALDPRVARISNAFTKKYKIEKLVYYEIFEDANEAIKREKQIKAGSRQKKIELIVLSNPSYQDLYATLL